MIMFRFCLYVDRYVYSPVPLAIETVTQTRLHVLMIAPRVISCSISLSPGINIYTEDFITFYTGFRCIICNTFNIFACIYFILFKNSIKELRKIFEIIKNKYTLVNIC